MGGDPAGPPQRQPPFQHPSPELGEAVAELEDPADLREPRLGGDTQCGGVLHQRELRDQWRTRTCDREGLVGEEPDTRGRVGLVQERPLDGRLGHLDIDGFPVGLVAAQHRKHLSRGGRSVWVAVLVMTTIQAPTTDTHDPETGVIHRPTGHGQITTFPLYYRGFEAEAQPPRPLVGRAGRAPGRGRRRDPASSHVNSTRALTAVSTTRSLVPRSRCSTNEPLPWVEQAEPLGEAVVETPEPIPGT